MNSMLTRCALHTMVLNMAKYERTVHAIEFTPVTTTLNYANGDVFGDLQEITGINQRKGLTLQSVTAIARFDQKTQFDLVFFDAPPVTMPVDNAAFALDATDIYKVCGGIRFTTAATDWVDCGTTLVTSFGGISLGLKTKTNGRLYVLAVLRSGAQYTGQPNAVTFKLYYQVDDD